ncbi:MAG TPA: BlaI/MecI/CopY family transcriptional regulator [Thermoanaerobaculia bacterium]|nr:BlaI/MecI/CopY family transcriptional regulator [Thermoanaerobaculia bacterium]
MTQPALSRREREILEVIFAVGDEASAEEIRERLSDPPSYSAVRAMLAKLEAKGAVKHKEKGLRYVYSPTMPRGKARKSALRRLVDVFFEGSKEQAVTALLSDEKWSDDELDELTRQIERVRRERSER